MRYSAIFVLIGFLFVPQICLGEEGPASFGYVLQADSFAKTKAVAVERLAECGRDWIIVDAAFGGDTPWDRADLDAMRRGQAGRKSRSTANYWKKPHNPERFLNWNGRFPMATSSISTFP